MGIAGLGQRIRGIMLLLVLTLSFLHCSDLVLWANGSIPAIGVLSKEFLDFSASRGNNLRSIGLEPGCKWCLCTARWKEAMEAAKGADDPVVPKFVFCLHPFNGTTC